MKMYWLVEERVLTQSNISRPRASVINDILDRLDGSTWHLFNSSESFHYIEFKDKKVHEVKVDEVSNERKDVKDVSVICGPTGNLVEKDRVLIINFFQKETDKSNLIKKCMELKAISDKTFKEICKDSDAPERMNKIREYLSASESSKENKLYDFIEMIYLDEDAMKHIKNISGNSGTEPHGSMQSQFIRPLSLLREKGKNLNSLDKRMKQIKEDYEEHHIFLELGL